MATVRKTTQRSKSTFTGIIIALLVLWLIALSLGTISFWRIYIAQAETDNTSIYNLTVDNALLRGCIDASIAPCTQEAYIEYLDNK